MVVVVRGAVVLEMRLGRWIGALAEQDKGRGREREGGKE